MSRIDKKIVMDGLVKELEELRGKREEQLEKEAYQSVNYTHVGGEISGLTKAIALIKQSKILN